MRFFSYPFHSFRATQRFAVRKASTDHPLHRVGEGSFKKNWLSDAGCYPIVVIMGFALTFCGSVSLTCLTSNPDVRIMPSKRNSVLRE